MLRPDPYSAATRRYGRSLRNRRKERERSLRALLCAALVACLGLGVGASAGAKPSLDLAAAQAPGGSPAARDLPLAPSVSASLVAAAAASHGLPASAFLGVAPANQGFAAYYGYDVATSTYWAAASLVPNPKSYEAQRRRPGRWRLSDLPPHRERPLEGAGRRLHRRRRRLRGLPHEHPCRGGRCLALGARHLPSARRARPATTTTSQSAAPLSGVALARHEWLLGARASPRSEGEYWVRAATALTGASGGDAG